MQQLQAVVAVQAQHHPAASAEAGLPVGEDLALGLARAQHPEGEAGGAGVAQLGNHRQLSPAPHLSEPAWRSSPPRKAAWQQRLRGGRSTSSCLTSS